MSISGSSTGIRDTQIILVSRINPLLVLFFSMVIYKKIYISTAVSFNSEFRNLHKEVKLREMCSVKVKGGYKNNSYNSL